MTAIVIGSTLGLASTSQTLPGAAGGNASTGSSGERVYVNAATGNLIVQRQDELLAARGIDIGVLRTYNSQGQLDGDNNDNWRIGFYRQIGNLSGTIGAAGSIVRTGEDGAAQKFTWNGSVYLSNDGDGAHDTLSWNSSTGLWTWTEGSSRTTETYDWNNGTGKLLQQADAAGNTVTFAYSAAGLVTHVASANSSATQFNYTDLTYDAANNLQSVTSSYWDAASGSNKTVSRVAYAYESWSGGNRLRTVTVDLTPDITADSKTYVTSYTYASGTSTLLAGLTQSDGTSLAFTYNVDGKLDSIRDALGQTTSYAYDTAHSRTSITDALGNVTVYGYDASGRVASVTTPAVGGVSAVTSYSWDTGGNLIAITDGEGKTTAMQYDDNGNLLLQRDGAGNTVTSSFDANNQLLTQTVYLVPDPDGDGAASAGTPLTTRYVYDAGGKSQLRFVISAEGRVTEYRYDGYGQRISSIQYRGNAYAGAAFAESDLQAWVDAAETDKTQSQRTDYAWDFRGQLASSTTWGSVDAGGNGVAGTDTTTTFVYSPDGRLLSTIAPLGGAGQTTSYTYDGLGRVLSATNGLGQVTSSVYDDAGNRTTITAANGLVAVNTYDAAGRRLSVQESGTAVSAQTRYYYDADNQLRMTRDANGVASWRLYDANGRKVGDIDGNGSLTEYIYDRDDRVIRTIAYANAVNMALLGTNADGSPSTTALSKTLANLRPATGADQSTWKVYDAAGRLVKTVGAGGAVVENIYDGDSKLVQSISYANAVSTAALPDQPSSAQVTPRADAANDRVTRYFYDGDGLKRAELDAEGYQAWDAAGHLVYEVDAAGYVTARQYDALGNVTVITRYADKIDDTTRSGWGTSAPSAATIAGLLNNASSANRSTTMQYDKAGRVTLEVRPVVYAYDVVNGVMTGATASPSTRSTYNAFGNLIRKEELDLDGSWSSSWFYYDGNGRQVAAIDALGYLSTRAYDAFGDVLRATEYANASSGAGASGYTPPASSAQDRTVLSTWDGDGHKLSDTRVAVEYLADTAQAGATLYTGANYSGTSITLGTGWYNLSSTAINEDTLSSIRLAAGWKATLYYYGNYAGSWITVTGDTADLSLASINFDNVASSIAIVNATTVGDLTTSYAYDAFGNRTTVTDASNNSAYTWYDLANRISAVADPARQGATDGSTVTALTQYVRDAFGNVIVRTDRALGANSVSKSGFTFSSSTNDRVSTNKYDSRGRKIESTDALGHTRYFSYDANGNVAKTWQGVTGKDQVTHTVYTEVTYDARGQAVYTDESGKINDLGKETQFAYDAFGELIARGGKEGSSTSLGWQEYFDYDNAGRLWRSNGKDGVNKVMLYDLQGNFTADIRSDSVDLHAQASAASVNALAGIRRVVSRFDALGRVAQQDLANGASVYQTWDRWGNRLSVSDARNASWVSSYTYNCNNQVTKETLPATSTVGSDFKPDTLVSPVTDYFYDRAGNLVTQRDARGNVSRKSWDAMGNLLAEFNANGSAVRHYYDVFNQEVTRVDALGNATGYAYDKMGRLTMVTRAAAQYFGINGTSYDASASPAASPVTLFDNTGMGGATSYFGAGTYTGLTKTFSSIQVLAGWTISLYGDNNQIKTYPTAGTNINTDLPANMDGHVIKLVVTHQGGSEARVDQVLNDVTQLSYVYDELGRRLSTTDARGASGATYYTYDLAGNVTGVMKPGETSYSTQYQYDNAGYKSGETDALNNTMSWTNDYFGRAQSHGTLDGKTSTYTYDYAGQVIAEVSTGGRNVANIYNTAGQITRIVDKLASASTRTTEYAYDLAGNRTREVTNIDAGTYQNETLNYDALGRLTDSTDIYGSSYARVEYAYDALGNRMRQKAMVNMTSNSASGATVKTTYFAYDALNRMQLVNGAVDNFANNTANLTSATGRRVYYDLNGNRTREDSSGGISLNYFYDALNRMIRSDKNGSMTRVLRYDLADRVIDSFDNTQASDTAAVHYTTLYDAQGHMLRQWHRAGSTAAADGSISTTSSRDDSTSYYIYDSLGNITRTYTQRFGDHLFHTAYTTAFTRIGDRYLRSTIVGKRTDNNSNPGTSTFTYDYNGYLTNFADSDNSANNRSYQDNASGQILRKSYPGGVTTKIMMANGQELGSYDSNGSIDFNVAYQAIDSIHPAEGPGSYEVNAGDTLQSIAFGAYGDRAMWYLIADANGLSSDATLTPGMLLKLPSAISSVHNSSQTFKPVDTANIIGITDPTVNAPTSGPSSSNTCRTVTVIIAAVVASIVITVAATAITVATLGALGVPAMSATGVLISLVFAAAAGAVSSMASQAVMIVGGLQDHMNWSDVAVSAATDLVTGGVSMAFGAVVRGAVSASRASRAAAEAAEAAKKAAAAGNEADAALVAARSVAKSGNRVKNLAIKATLWIYGDSGQTADIAKTVFRRGDVKKYAISMARFSARALVDTAQEVATNAISNSIEQGIQLAVGTRDNFDTDYLAQSLLSPGSMKQAEFQRSSEAEGEIYARLAARVRSRLQDAQANGSQKRADALQKLVPLIQDAGATTKTYGGRKWGTKSAIEFVKKGTGFATSATSAVLSSGSLFERGMKIAGYFGSAATLVLQFGYRDAYASLVTSTSSQDTAGGRETSFIANGVAGLLTTRMTHRAAGIRIFQTAGGASNISARYTDTATFQAMQYGINVAASLVSNAAWDIASGSTDHLDSMRMQASEEAIRMATSYNARRV